MGYGTFDSGASAARAAFRHSTGTSAFTHDTDIKAGRKTAACHESLDLTKKPKRECFDNDDNPNSVPIGVIVDVTGSMGSVADLVINSLHKVISTIKDRGVVTNPSICFGAVGDANSDRVPMQMGEFESDDELAEQHLSHIYREGAGGGQHRESYELPMWFFANQVTTDHWNKRGGKGFLFLIGDEAPYPTIKASQVEAYCGEIIGEDVDLRALTTQLLERWHVFVLRPGGTSCYDMATVQDEWEKILGAERVIKVQNWEEINSLIAGTISVISGVSVADTVAAMKDSGLAVGTTTTNALATLEFSASMVVSAPADDSAAPASRL
jgi:hypothetical protein